jgi:hypothetical protein
MNRRNRSLINKGVATLIAAIAAVAMGGSRLRAQVGSSGSSGIPLSQLAGSFAGGGTSNYSVCFNKNFTAVQSCSKTPLAQIVPFVNNSTSQGTSDTKGHSCSEVVDAGAPLFPGPEPAIVNHYILVGVTTSYNPATGSGDASFKFYIAGPGVTCKGATFVNTAKAPVSYTATEHIVVSENGTRLDAVALTFHTISPVDFIAGDVAHSFALRQIH